MYSKDTQDNVLLRTRKGVGEVLTEKKIKEIKAGAIDEALKQILNENE